MHWFNKTEGKQSEYEETLDYGFFMHDIIILYRNGINTGLPMREKDCKCTFLRRCCKHEVHVCNTIMKEFYRHF